LANFVHLQSNDAGIRFGTVTWDRYY